MLRKCIILGLRFIRERPALFVVMLLGHAAATGAVAGIAMASASLLRQLEGRPEGVPSALWFILALIPVAALALSLIHI